MTVGVRDNGPLMGAAHMPAVLPPADSATAARTFVGVSVDASAPGIRSISGGQQWQAAANSGSIFIHDQGHFYYDEG